VCVCEGVGERERGKEKEGVSVGGLGSYSTFDQQRHTQRLRAIQVSHVT